MNSCVYLLLVVLFGFTVCVADGAPAPDDDDSKINPATDSDHSDVIITPPPIIVPVTDETAGQTPTTAPSDPLATTENHTPTTTTTTTDHLPPVPPPPTSQQEASCQVLGAGQYKSIQPSTYFRCIWDERIKRWLKPYGSCIPGYEFVNSLKKCVKP